jgi:ribosomal protein S8
MNIHYNRVISQLKNGYINKSLTICTKNLKKNREFLKILLENGFIRGFTIINEKKIKIFLKYTSEMTPSLDCVVLVEKVKQRKDVGIFNVNNVFRDFHAVCINTPFGSQIYN